MTIAELTQRIRLNIATAIPANLAIAPRTKASKIAGIANLAVAKSQARTIQAHQSCNCLQADHQQFNPPLGPKSKIIKGICECGYRPPFCACGHYKCPG